MISLKRSFVERIFQRPISKNVTSRPFANYRAHDTGNWESSAVVARNLYEVRPVAKWTMNSSE